MEERPTCVFLPGTAPAVVRYAALIRELGARARAHTKELDFSDEMRAELASHRELQRSMLDDPARAMATFLRLEPKPGVEFAPPPDAPPSLPNRPSRMAASLRAFEQQTIDLDALRGFRNPVLYTRGSLSADRYERSARRLADVFQDFREVVFDGLHHLNTSNQASRPRLLELWVSAPS